MIFNRQIKLEEWIEKGKVVSIFGPRQCGKTFLVNEFLKTYTGRYSFESGTFRNVQYKFMDGPKQEVIDIYGQNYDLVVFDEAQLIPGIGENMKALVDTYPNIMVILTGSSSFDLAGQIGEPLYGRQKTINLFPLWEKEISDSGFFPNLEERLLYGSYPEVVLNKDNNFKEKKLKEYSDAALFKDILAFDKLKKPKVLIDLIKLLAYCIGSEVSVTKLAKDLSVNQKTVEKYLEILEKSFVIFTLGSYARNEANEIKKKKKYYFYDLGIRNAVLGDFNSPNVRQDIGGLWENYCILERLKRNSYLFNWVQKYFWRNFNGQEIDYLELRDGTVKLFEFKWNKESVKKVDFTSDKFKIEEMKLVNNKNYRDFIL